MALTFSDESSVDDDNVFPAVPNSASISSGSSSCKTPARNFGFGNTSDISMMKTPGSGRGSSERIRRMRNMIRTPSGPRMNPFESHLSTDMLQGPTFSPSVFSTVVSPSQEKVRKRLWPIFETGLFSFKFSFGSGVPDVPCHLLCSYVQCGHMCSTFAHSSWFGCHGFESCLVHFLPFISSVVNRGPQGGASQLRYEK